MSLENWPSLLLYKKENLSLVVNTKNIDNHSHLHSCSILKAACHQMFRTKPYILKMTYQDPRFNYI